MTSYVTPKKNTAFKFYIGLIDQSNTKLLKANPTIAIGDFKVSTDGGAFGNLATLPSANPASGRAVMIDLSSGEMNGDNVVVQCVDAAGAEWCDLLIALQTTAQQIDDLAALTATQSTNLGKTTGAIGRGTVTTGGSTTSIPTSAFTPSGAVANQFTGRVIMFDADTTTTGLRGQATVISASSNAATPTFTVTAMTTAPVSGDTFSVI